MSHGRYGYEKRGCRCAICRAANAAKVARTRARRLARLLASPIPESDDGHGTQGGYDAGCRCEACRCVRSLRYFSAEGGPRRHYWREQVVQTYRDWRDSWEALREQITLGYLYNTSRESRRRSLYTDEYVDFLADRPAPTLRAVLVGLSQSSTQLA